MSIVNPVLLVLGLLTFVAIGLIIRQGFRVVGQALDEIEAGNDND